MEITEKERRMLVKKKEKIRNATLKILEMFSHQTNCLEIKKQFQFILEGLSTIASYSDSKNYDLDKYTVQVDALFKLMTSEDAQNIWILSPIAIEHICIITNSVEFQLTKKKRAIVLPKIKNVNLGYNVNQ